MSDKKLNVAVVGGGMGGLCAAIALLKNDHISVQVYEAAHKFSEIGAGVAFGPNAQRALKLIGADAEAAYQSLATHNISPEYRHVWFEIMYGMGEREGQVIAAPWNETGQSSVHRAKFLDNFVKLIPSEIAHFGKRLDRIHEYDDSVELHFKDGTTATADCVIGADGIHSVIRHHLLGDGHPALDPVFTGSVAYRGLIPMDEAVAALGERYAKNSFVLNGRGKNIMIYPIDFGATMNVVLSNGSYESWDGEWVRPADFESIKSEFAEFSELGRKIVALLDRPETMAWSLWDHPPAPTYCRNRVVMLGDAAHASTPFQGQGAGQAIEDAYVLASMLSLVQRPADIEHAFKAYDVVRRPRSQRVCKTSREAGELNCLRLPGVEDDIEALKENLSWRMDWMWHRDIEGERNEAEIFFRGLVQGEKMAWV